MQVSIVLVVLSGIIACSVARTFNDDDLIWDAYKIEFNKVYENESVDQLRRMIFQDNKKIIDDHNERWLSGEETYQMGFNQFSDMLDEEYSEAIGVKDEFDNAFGDVEIQSSDDFDDEPKLQIPHSVNWTQRGVVSPVVYQKGYNNSWAFAAAGVVESRQAIRKNRMIILSKQNLIDCCSTKDISRALVCIKKMRGIDTEVSYPYRGYKGNCRFCRRTVGARIRLVYKVRPGNETLLARTVSMGPVAAVISQNVIKHYRSGVFDDAHCGGTSGFPVLIVGYGNCKRFGDFWIIKTPLGIQWGEKGYLRLARNKKNLCGITNSAFFPVV